MCGGTRTADSTLQYIATPNWPMRYPANTRCKWVISSSTINFRVQVHFLGINTETFEDEISVSSRQIVPKIIYYLLNIWVAKQANKSPLKHTIKVRACL